MSLRVSLNSLYWPGSDERIVSGHKLVCSHFGLDVNYHEEKINHGLWMSEVLKSSSADVIGFFDIDCVPIKKTAVLNFIKYVANNKTIAGCAQVSNHIPPMNHVYVAACAIFIWRDLYIKLGSPVLHETQDSDTAENLTRVAESNGVRMQAIYPTKFEREPDEGVWRLNNYGFFGVGTVFGDDQFYHLYQSRFEQNIDLFSKRCEQIVMGGFSSKEFYNSTDFNYPGKICCYPQEQQLRKGLEV